MVNGLWTEAEQILKEIVPGQDSTAVAGGELTCTIVSRIMSYVLVGPSLCRNPKWQKIAIEATFAIVEASLGLRSKYTPNWRWLAKFQNTTAQKLDDIRKEATELIKPLYDARTQSLRETDGRDSRSFYDTMYWILTKRKADKTLQGIVDQELFLTLTSIHTTAGTLQSILFDWLDHPEYHAEIMAEINDVLAEVKASGGKWTLQKVAAMKKLDSFMKESTRVNPVGFSRTPPADPACYTIANPCPSDGPALRAKVSCLPRRVLPTGRNHIPLRDGCRAPRPEYIS